MACKARPPRLPPLGLGHSLDGHYGFHKVQARIVVLELVLHHVHPDKGWKQAVEADSLVGVLHDGRNEQPGVSGLNMMHDTLLGRGSNEWADTILSIAPRPMSRVPVRLSESYTDSSKIISCGYLLLGHLVDGLADTIPGNSRECVAKTIINTLINSLRVVAPANYNSMREETSDLFRSIRRRLS